MTRKKMLTKCTAAILSMTVLLSACSSTSTAPTDATTTGVSNSAGTETEYVPGKLPIVEEKITLTVIIPSVGWVPDIVNNQYNQYLEETTNIHIEWMEVTKEEYAEKIAILIAGGEYPDIIFDTGLSKAKLDSYGMQGMFVDISQYIDPYSTNLKKMISDYPKLETFMTATDGKSYFMPSYDSVYHMSMATKYWINQTWLNNLGLSMPTTTDEFREVLRQFKAQDANGNGDPNDEIPMTGAIRAFEDTTSFLLSSYVPAGGPSFTGDPNLNNYAFIMDGTPTFVADKEEFKQGLTYIKELYDEGLYDPAAFTQNRDQVKALVDGGDANRVGGLVSHHPGNFAAQADVENGRFRDYVALPPLAGFNGYKSVSWDSMQGVSVGAAITDKCENPVAAFLWLDNFLSDENATITKLGWEGVNWEKAAEGDMGFNGEPAVFRLLEAPVHETNTILGFLGPKNSMILDGRQKVADGYDYEQILYSATMEYDLSKVERYPFVAVAMEDADAAKLLELAKNLESYVGESIDRFILGDLSLDTDWETYCQTLNQIGLQDYMDILNKYYQ